MELLARLEHIELKITQIKEQNKKLIIENEQLKNEKLGLQIKLEDAAQKLKNLEETNKIIKLAHSIDNPLDRAKFIKKIDRMIHEIDQCIELINL
ncbi:MAG: hypothetical protein P8I43_03995 [Bacteroidia bacterium]|jgi:hypothetical protein|nr:hypothetical protein [Bacteroidia bacterium]|tara:strand:- start:2173 stop:2457 length:285 start_codon:yes stop_codon:yes gene_type:complete